MNKFEKLITQLNAESLSDAEKARMKRVLTSYMHFKPAPQPVARVTAAWGWLVYLHRPVAAALVLVLVTGTGVSYAAESALPGDVLYMVKTTVNEPIRVAVAINTETRAEIQMQIAERRIEEATTLAADDRLDEATQDELALSFESHAAAASESIDKTATVDTAVSLELAERFETRLLAHESVLAEVDAELHEDVRSYRLAQAIRNTNEKFAEKRSERLGTRASAVIAAIVPDTSLEASATGEDAAVTLMAEQASFAASEVAPPEKKAEVAPPAAKAEAPDERTIARMKRAAEKSLAATEKALRNTRSLSAEAKASAEADIAAAALLIDEGTGLAEFRESLHISERAIVYIKAAPSLEKVRNRAPRRMNERQTAPLQNITAPLSEGTIQAETDIQATTEDVSVQAEIRNPDDVDEREPDGVPDEKETKPGSKDYRFHFFQKLDISL